MWAGILPVHIKQPNYFYFVALNPEKILEPSLGLVCGMQGLNDGTINFLMGPNSADSHTVQGNSVRIAVLFLGMNDWQCLPDHDFH